MANSPSAPAAGFVTFTLHSHLPYVVHHGTWPHGLDWLHEAAAETYLPLLRVFAELESQGFDVVTVADQRGVALRGGHHCTQPLMRKLGIESTARASFYFYNTKAEVDRFVEVVREIQKFFAG